MYKVIREFADLQDNSHIYHTGDIFPRDGKKASLEREQELLGKDNKIGEPLIEYIPDKEDEEKPAKKKKK